MENELKPKPLTIMGAIIGGLTGSWAGAIVGGLVGLVLDNIFKQQTKE